MKNTLLFLILTATTSMAFSRPINCQILANKIVEHEGGLSGGDHIVVKQFTLNLEQNKNNPDNEYASTNFQFKAVQPGPELRKFVGQTFLQEQTNVADPTNINVRIALINWNNASNKKYNKLVLSLTIPSQSDVLVSSRSRFTSLKESTETDLAYIGREMFFFGSITVKCQNKQ